MYLNAIRPGIVNCSGTFAASDPLHEGQQNVILLAVKLTFAGVVASSSSVKLMFVGCT